MSPRAFLGAAALILAASFSAAPRADAADVTISAGRSFTTDTRWTTAAFVDISGRTRELAGVHWQPTASLGWIDGRDTRTADLDHTVYIGAAGVRLVDWWHGAFFAFELGAAGGRTDAISSSEQFVSSLGWEGEHWTVMVRHVSNGEFFGGRNLGETMLLAGVRF